MGKSRSRAGRGAGPLPLPKAAAASASSRPSRSCGCARLARLTKASASSRTTRRRLSGRRGVIRAAPAWRNSASSACPLLPAGSTKMGPVVCTCVVGESGSTKSPSPRSTSSRPAPMALQEGRQGRSWCKGSSSCWRHVSAGGRAGGSRSPGPQDDLSAWRNHLIASAA